MLKRQVFGRERELAQLNGVTGLGAGSFQDAYEQLRRLFDPTDIVFHPAQRS